MWSAFFPFEMEKLSPRLIAHIGSLLVAVERAAFEGVSRAVCAALRQYAAQSWAPALLLNAQWLPPAATLQSMRPTELTVVWLLRPAPRDLVWIGASVRVLSLHAGRLPGLVAGMPQRLGPDCFRQLTALRALVELRLEHFEVVHWNDLLPLAPQLRALALTDCRRPCLPWGEDGMPPLEDVLRWDKWTALETLALERTEDAQHDNLRELPALRTLTIDNVSVRFCPPRQLRELRVLRTRRAAICEPEQSFYVVGAASELRAITLHHCSLPATLPRSLHHLALLDCDLGVARHLLPLLEGLTVLTLVGTPVTRTDVALLTALPALRELTLANAALDRHTLEPLAQCRAPLALLDLSNDARRRIHYPNGPLALGALVPLPHLRRLCLHDVEYRRLVEYRDAEGAVVRRWAHDVFPLCPGPTRHRRIFFR